MSKQVDERVVSMEFDNKRFESNVATSMSTLDKLKAKLNFKDSAKSLDGVKSAAKKFDLSRVSSSAEAVGVKFSALQVAGVTALTKITNAAINAGTQLVKSLSIDQITAGWTKYGQKTASIQTIMNATGKNIDEINTYLEKLMWFSDETSYGFTDMTAALGQMASSGGDIDKLIPLITGVANATAFAGKGAAEFSRSMYNLNQSYGAGFLQYQDWRSLDLAGTSSKQLKQAIIDAGVALGKIKEGEVTLENFATTLKDKWATTEVLEVAFARFSEFSDAVYELVESGAVDTASEAIEQLAGKYGDIGETAFKAAQEAKTFSEAIDATKDAVSSGWMETFEILFGNYEQAKKLWTGLANWLWDVFASGGEERNNWLKAVMSFDPWEALMKKLDASGLGTIKKYVDGISNMTKSLEYYQDVMTAVWRGDYKNAPDRYGLLEAAGHDYRVIQDLVNLSDTYYKGAGYKYQLTLEDVQNSQKKFGVAVTESAQSAEDLNAVLSNLTDEQLKQAGMTAEEIQLFRDLTKEAERLGIPIKELVDKMSKKDGRTLLFESIANAGKGLVTIMDSIKSAFKEIFPPISAVRMYTLIDGLNKLSQYFIISEDNADKLRRTFKGVFALFDIIGTILGGPIKLGFKLLGQFLKALDIPILDFTAGLGDMIVQFRDWLDGTLDMTETFEKLAPSIKKAAEAVSKWISNFKDSKFIEMGKNIVEGLVKGLGQGTKFVWDVMTSLAKGIIDLFCSILGIHSPSLVFLSLGLFIILGLVNGLTGGSLQLPGVIGYICDSILRCFKNGLAAIPTLVTNVMNTISSLFASLNLGKIAATILKGVGTIANQIRKGFFTTLGISDSDIQNWLMNLANRIGELAKKIPFGKIIGAAVSGGMTASMYNFSKGFRGLVAPLEGVGSFLEDAGEGVKKALKGLGKALKGFGSMLSGLGAKLRAEAIFTISKAILVLVAALIVLALAVKDPHCDFNGALHALGVLTVILLGISAAASKIGSIPNLLKFSVAIAAIGAAMVLMAWAVQKLMDSGDGNIESAMHRLVMIAAIITTMGLVMNKAAAGGFAKDAGSSILKMTIAVAIMVVLIKQIGKLDAETILQGIFVLGVLTLFIHYLGSTGAKAGEFSGDAGNMLLKIATALVTFVAVIKAIDALDAKAIIKGFVVIGALSVFIKYLGTTAKMGKKNADKVGSMILQFSIAMLLLAFTLKVIASIDDKNLARGSIVILGFGKMISLLVSVVKSNGKHIWQIGTVLMSMAMAIGILTLVMYAIQFLDTKDILRGGAAIVAMMTCFTALVYVTKFASRSKNVKDVLWGLVGAVAVLTLCIWRLSTLDQAGVATAAASLAAVVGVFAVLVNVTQHLKAGEKTYKRNLATLGVLAGVVIAMGLILYLLSSLENPEAVAASAAGLSALLLSLAGAVNILSNSKISSSKTMNDKKLLEIGKMLAVMVGVMVVLSVLVWALSKIENPQGALMSAGAVSLLLITMAGTMMVLSNLKVPASGSLLKNILMLAAMVAPLIVFTAALAFMPAVSDSAINTLKVLLPVMAAMTGLLVALSFIDKIGGWNNLRGILALTAMVVPLAVFTAALAFMPTVSEGCTNTLKALLPVMTYMTLLLVPLALLGTFGFTGALGGIVLLTAMVIPLGVFANALAKMPPMAEHAVGTLRALLPVMTLMTLLLIPLTLIGAFGPAAFVGIAALTTFIVKMTAVVTAIGGIFELIKPLKTAFDTGIEFLVKLAEGIGRAIGSFIRAIATEVLKLLPTLALSLSLFAVYLTPFLAVMRTIDWRVAEGAVALVAALAAFVVAELLAIVADVLGVGLPLFGLELSLFILSAWPFISALSQITPQMATAAKNLAQLVVAITASSVIDGIASFFGCNVAGFGEKLASFGGSIKEFKDSISDLSDDDLKRVDLAAKAGAKMSEMAKTLPRSDGWLQKIIGEQDMEKFSKSIVSFGKAMVSFGGSVSTLTDDDIDKINKAADAGKAMAELEGSIPKKDGLLQEITGVGDFTSFGTGMVSFGNAITSYAAIIRGKLTDEDATNIQRSAECGAALAELESKLQGKDGFMQFFTGDKDFTEFGNGIYQFAQGLLMFTDAASYLAGYDDCVADVENVGTILDAMIKTIEPYVTNEQSWFSMDSTDMQSFGTGMYNIAEGIQAFVAVADMCDGIPLERIQEVSKYLDAIKNVITETDATYNYEQSTTLTLWMENVRRVIDVIKEFVTYSATVTDDDNNNIARVETAIQSLNTMGNNLTGLDTAKAATAISRLESLAGAMTALTLADYSGVDTLKSSIEKINALDTATFSEKITALGGVSLETFVDGFVTAANDASGVTTAVKDAALTLVEVITNTIDGSKNTVALSFSDLITGAAGKGIGTEDHILAFHTAGVNLGEGLINGIEAMEDSVYEAAYALGQLAVQGEKDGQQSESPSKLTTKAGKWLGEGLIIGMRLIGKKVYASSENLGSTTTNIISDAVSGIADAINSDIDAEPTIRPVLDLTDLRSGAASIDGMLSGNRTLSVDTATIGSLSASMSKLQNGNNSSELLSAIKALRKDVANNPRNTYSIAGINFTEGSDVADAIETIVRAIKVEGRT